ncbi:MAG: hypothetical protein ACOCVK_02840, partial [bacterium]
HRLEDTSELRSVTDARLDEGYTPTAIDISSELGLSMLYSRVSAWPATTYAIEELDSLENLNEVVTERIREGWFPMDFSFQNETYVLLFTDSPETLDGWRLVGTSPSFMEIQRTIARYKDEGFTPVGISATDDNQLALLLLSLPDREAPKSIVVGVSKDPEEVTILVQSMIGEGWTPMSVTTAPNEFVMLFLMY